MSILLPNRTLFVKPTRVFPGARSARGRTCVPGLLALILLPLLPGAGMVFGQTPPATDSPADPPAVSGGVSGEAPPRPRTRAELERLGLDPNPMVAEALGLRMNPPIESNVQVQRVEDRVTVSLVDSSEIPSWSMRIHTMTSTLQNPTPEAQIAQLIENWRRDGRQFQILSDEPIVCDGRSGRLCYVHLQNTSGDEIVTGWLLLPFGGRDFLVFSMQAMPEKFPSLRALLETSFSTLRMEPPTQIANKRRARLDAATAFLAAVTPERLRSLVGYSQWYRYYAPAGTAAATAASDTELGYYVLTFSESELGAVDPNRPRKRFDEAEQALGLLVHVAGHYIDPANELAYDSDAYYWMAWDQSEEAWSIRGTRREGSREESEALTGIRTPQSTGDPFGTITVINSARNGAKRDEDNWRAPEVYLSQAPRWALGRLLVLTGADPRTMSSYCFDTTSPKPSISLRVDRWEPVTGAASREARWRLASQARSDMPQVISLYDEDGWLVKRSWQGGQVSEPIVLEDLHRLWRSKGLPTGRMSR